MKQEFEMLQSEMDEILRINREVQDMPVMMIGNVITGGEKREAINDYWKQLGEKYRFKWDTVEGSAKGNLFFLAEPLPPPKSKEEIEMDKYDSLQKIIDQLESCHYECEGGFLENNIAFRSLKRMAEK